MNDNLLYETCINCKGEGIIEKDIETEYGWRAMLVTCENCDGSGKVLKEEEESE